MSFFRQNERLAAFIDGGSIYRTARDLGAEINYGRLRDWLRSESQLFRVYYYALLVEQTDYSPVKPLTDWLGYNGYHVNIKPTREYEDAAGRRIMKANNDVEIAVDMLEMAPHVDHVVLFSGEGSLRRAVEVVQSKGVRVTCFSMRSAAADELRRQVDQFVEMTEIIPLIQKLPHEIRPMRRPAVVGRADAVEVAGDAGEAGEAEVLEDRRETQGITRIINRGARRS